MSFPQFEDFQKDYPNLFREYPCCGFALPNGWSSLVKQLCNILEFRLERLSEETRKQVYCVQIKQKFGSLRLYMSKQDDYITGAIALAENMSAHICEVCGNPGKKIDNNGWLETLCDKDAENIVK